MDAIDQRIVALLRENARRSFQDIGGHVHLSAPAVKRRVDRLEHDGVVLGYAAIVDPEAFGWRAEAFVDLYCDGDMSADAVRAAVATEAGAILHVMAEDTKALELALERIRATSGVTRTVTQVVLSTLFNR
jgi:DNA-binding Lrp family transcriptional regulator